MSAKAQPGAPVVLHSIANMFIEGLAGTPTAVVVPEATIARITQALYDYARRGVALAEPVAALLSIGKGADANGMVAVSDAITCILNDLGRRLSSLQTDQARDRNRARASLGLIAPRAVAERDERATQPMTMKPWAVR